MFDRTPTLADVCSAIADGQIVFTIDGPMYQINALELRRYLNRSRGLPPISPSQDARLHCEPEGWSTSRPSVA
jgi:hypothetical protein